MEYAKGLNIYIWPNLGVEYLSSHVTYMKNKKSWVHVTYMKNKKTH